MTRRDFLKALGLTTAAVAFVGLPQTAETWDGLLRLGDRFTVRRQVRETDGPLQEWLVTAIDEHGIKAIPTPPSAFYNTAAYLPLQVPAQRV